MVKRIKPPGNFRYFLSYFFHPKLWFVIFLPFLTIILGQKDVIVARLSAQIFNNLQFLISGDKDISLLKQALFYSILIFLVHISGWLITTISDFIENCWRESINVKLQTKFIEKDFKINRCDLHNPNLQSRRNVAQGVDFVGQIKTILTGIGNLIALFSFAFIMWQYSPIMILVAIIVKVPLLFLIKKNNKDDRDFHIATDVLNREKNYYKGIPVDKTFVKEFKIFNLASYVCEKYDQIISKYYKCYRGRYTKNTISNSIINHYDRLITIIVQIIIGISVFTGKMLFGDYTLLIAAFKSLTGSCETIVEYVAQCQDMQTKHSMLREYLEDQSIYESGEHNFTDVNEGSHTIHFQNVSFAYPGTDKEILHNLNLTISAGKTHGLVGLNGSGKSTLVNLLLRLYEPDSGEILLDGVNIKEYNIHSYYEAIACVFQSTTHYAMPIRDYISAGKPCDIEKVQAAIRQVKLEKWCDELPHGLDTMLTRAFTSETDSVEPSIGQWQKLSIARAIYKDAPIMILDEPSASLDVDSENEIFNYIIQLTVKKTAILISHRLSNIIGCDHIFVLQDGCLVEQGNHQTLLEMGGVYANLFNSQAKYYKSE